MTPAEINRLLDEAFEKWVKVVGLDLDATSWSISLGGQMDSWTLKKQADRLQEARRLDDTGLTCFMLFRVLVEEYIGQETVTALDIIKGLSPEQQARIDSLREMREFLERPVLQEYVTEFTDRVRQATAHYGIDHDDLEAWLSSDYWMATLRRDALRSAEGLEAHQFCWGTPAGGEPQYGLEVLEFWNIPSLVRAMQAMGQAGVPGVHVCLIRDPEGALRSFFVIAIVNGESLTVLTDREKTPHPDAKRMSRRPDRRLEDRAWRHWFPYNLLDLEVAPDERSLHAKKRSDLVPVNAQATPLSPFSKLPPGSAIWLTLVFDLVKERYLGGNHRLPALSYTAEMVRTPELLASQGSALVASGRYTPLAAPDLSLTDISTEALAEEGQWDHETHGANQWMLDRYAHLVPTEVLNLVGHNDVLALEAQQEKAKLIAEAPLPGWHPAAIARSWKTGEVSALKTKGLRSMDPVSFGTAEAMHRDRKWTARANVCRVVQRLAEKEYVETADSLYRSPTRRDEPEPSGWVLDRLRERQDWIVEQVVRGEWVVESHYWGGSFDGPFRIEGVAREEPKPVNLVKWGLGAAQNWPRNSYYSESEVLLGQKLPHPGIHLSEWADSARRYCAVDGAVATYHAVIEPSCAQDIAELLGLKFDHLPWQLQVWVRKQPDYRGNPILDRVDPAEWMLHNPWAGESRGGWGTPNAGLDLTVGISLSRRTVNRERKRLGLPPFDWKARNERSE